MPRATRATSPGTASTSPSATAAGPGRDCGAKSCSPKTCFPSAIRASPASGAQAEKAHQVERLLDGARGSLTPPRARAAAVHAVDDVTAAHPLAAEQRPRFLGVLIARLADLHAIGGLEPARLELLAH